MPQIVRTSPVAKQPVGVDGIAMTEVPTPKSEARSDAPHDLPDDNTTSSPYFRLCTMMRKLIPRSGATTHPKYRIVNTVKDPEISRKNDSERKWSTEPRPLKRFSTFTYTAICWDVLMTLLPVAFLGESIVYVLTGRFLYTFSSNLLYYSLRLSQFTTPVFEVRDLMFRS